MHLVRKKLKYVEVAIAALLKQHKFKKDRLTWRKEQDGLMYILNIQLSQWNEEGNIQFFINLGVFDAAKYQEKYKHEEKKPKEYQCQRRERLTDLMGLRKTFHIDWSVNEKALALDIVANIETHAFDWFEKGLE